MRTKISLLVLMIISISLNAQNIEFTFENAQTTNDGSNVFYEADVMIATVDGLADFKLGRGQIYINYNPSAFGSSIHAADGLEITYPTGYILEPYYSSFVTNDNGEVPQKRFSFSYQQALSAFAMTNNVTSIPGKLFHLKMKFTDAGQLPMVAFEDNESQPPGVSNSRDQFFTACGPFAGGTFADCTGFSGSQLNDVLFNNGGATLSIDKPEIFNSLSIYPNPTKDLLYVNVNVKSKYRVIDMFGKIVKMGSFDQGENELQLRKYEAGVYFLRVINDSKVITKKIVLE